MSALTVDGLIELMHDTLGRKLTGTELHAGTRFDALDLSSLDVAEVFFAVEDGLDVELDLGDAPDPETIGELVERVNALAGGGRVEVTE